MPCPAGLLGTRYFSPAAALKAVDIPRRKRGRQKRTFTCLSGYAIEGAEGTASIRWRQPLQGAPGKPSIVALGKFDALHKGHRSLAVEAANLGGYPWLVSFSGMAEVLGWPKRPPLVADCDRSRVLDSWAPFCNGLAPRLRLLPFTSVRSMSPEQFVDLLAQHLQVSGVVVGKGYRFGYKQAGDTDMLKELGREAGLTVCVTDLVGASTPGVVGKVSSSEVRRALAMGKMHRVQDYIGRPYRLIAILPALQPQNPIRIPPECFLNQLPGYRRYGAKVEVVLRSGEVVALEESEVIVKDSGVSIAHCALKEIPNPASDVQIHIDF